MGCFGYICKGCGTPVRGDCFNGGELCHMKHVRHGEVIGEVTGHYDEYGRVIEQDKDQPGAFRGYVDGPNSHREICKSEFDFEDSDGSHLNYMRIIDGERISWDTFLSIRHFEIYIKFKDHAEGMESALTELEKSHDALREEFDSYPKVEREIKSGIAVWHKKCYDKATDEQRADLTPSAPDPDQSCGKVRKKFK